MKFWSTPISILDSASLSENEGERSRLVRAHFDGQYCVFFWFERNVPQIHPIRATVRSGGSAKEHLGASLQGKIKFYGSAIAGPVFRDSSTEITQAVVPTQLRPE